MDTITGYLSSDHARCDDLFAAAETAVSKGRWDEAAALFGGFEEGLERHFAMEEKVLFVAFEKATGSSAGPTAVMRMEHAQIRSIMTLLHDAMANRDADDFLGHAETLNTMIQQHNMKEESILYPMTDRMLSTEREPVLEAMNAIGVEA
jgi:hemerythrin-like domain-containing protein